MIELELAPTTAAAPGTLGPFLDALRPHSPLPLVFIRPGGEEIREGYHVTEVMANAIRSIDCGGRPEAWTETVIQLLDEQDPNARAMSVGRFLGIVNRVAVAVDLGDESRVVLEWGRPGEAAVRFTPGNVNVGEQAVHIEVTPVYATCKPRGAGACC
jgi:hypothetical protein